MPRGNETTITVAGWRVTDKSFVTKGVDPTLVGSFELVNVYGREIYVTEFFGDYYLEFDTHPKYGPFSTNRINSWLETLGAPTMDWIYDALTHERDSIDQANEQNPFYEADQALLRYMH